MDLYLAPEKFHIFYKDDLQAFFIRMDFTNADTVRIPEMIDSVCIYQIYLDDILGNSPFRIHLSKL